MQVPILKQGSHLIATVQSALTDADLVQLRDAIVEQVGRTRARGVIIDVTALDVVDSFATATMRDLAQMIRLRGARTVIVGIQPEVAFAMVQMGLTLEGVTTTLDLEDALEHLGERTRQAAPSSPSRAIGREADAHSSSPTLTAPICAPRCVSPDPARSPAGTRPSAASPRAIRARAVRTWKNRPRVPAVAAGCPGRRPAPRP